MMTFAYVLEQHA